VPSSEQPCRHLRVLSVHMYAGDHWERATELTWRVLFGALARHLLWQQSTIRRYLRAGPRSAYQQGSGEGAGSHRVVSGLDWPHRVSDGPPLMWRQQRRLRGVPLLPAPPPKQHPGQKMTIAKKSNVRAMSIGQSTWCCNDIACRADGMHQDLLCSRHMFASSGSQAA
jgi:hypothetical protein